MWFIGLILHLWFQHLSGALAHVLAASLLFGSWLVDWEGSGEWPKASGPCVCMGDTEEAPGSSHFGHLGREAAGGRSLFPSLQLLFK